MLASRKQLAIGCNLLLLILLTEVEGFSRKWYNSPVWKEAGPKNTAENNKPLESSWRVSFEGRAQRENIQYPSGSPSRNNGRPKEAKFVFPDDAMAARRRQPVPACKGSTFCEDIAGYPNDLVNRIILQNRNHKKYEDIDAMDSISQRMGIDDSESLCLSVEKIVFPKSAESMNNEWLFIVNHPNFTQGVRIETCVNQGNSCMIIDELAEGYTTSCEQKYIYRQLTAIANDGTLNRDFFRFPASCCCHVRFTGMQSRMRRSDIFLRPPAT